jgi:hypothetical protein
MVKRPRKRAESALDPTLNFVNEPDASCEDLENDPSFIRANELANERSYEAELRLSVRGLPFRHRDANAAIVKKSQQDRLNLAEPEPRPQADSMLTHQELAAHFRCNPNVARKKLDRWRANNKSNPDWEEIKDRRGPRPKYRYRFSEVRHLFERPPKRPPK